MIENKLGRLSSRTFFQGDRNATSHTEEPRNGSSRAAHREHKHVGHRDRFLRLNMKIYF